jgi:Transposase DDE domain group 1
LRNARADSDIGISTLFWIERGSHDWNGHYACTCYHPLFVLNQFGDLERSELRAGNVHSANGWDGVLKPVVAALLGQGLMYLFPGGRSLCQSRCLRVSRSRADQVAFQPIRSSRTGSAICSSARSGDARTYQRLVADDRGSHVFYSNRQEECVRMPGKKMTRSDPRAPLGVPTRQKRSAPPRRSRRKAGQVQILTSGREHLGNPR